MWRHWWSWLLFALPPMMVVLSVTAGVAASESEWTPWWLPWILVSIGAQIVGAGTFIAVTHILFYEFWDRHHNLAFLVFTPTAIVFSFATWIWAFREFVPENWSR